MKELDLYRFEFKKQLIGGYDRLDVLKKMQQLNSKYQDLMENQKEYYESIIKDLKENGTNNITTTKVIHVYEDASSNARAKEPDVKDNTRKEKIDGKFDAESESLLETLNNTIDSMTGYHVSKIINYTEADGIPAEKEDKIEIKFIDEDTTKEEIDEVEELEETEEVNEIDEEIEEPSLFDDIKETNFFSYSDEDEAERNLNQDIIERIDAILEAPIEEMQEPAEEADETYDFDQAVKEIESIEKEIVSRTEKIIETKPKKRRERGAIREIVAPDKETIAKKRAARRRKVKKANAAKPVEEKPKTGKRRARGAIEELKSSK